ncbi:MAG: hypothetical protein FD175_2825 [Beijerinckiaceae bacterium]|nr:MAG: hypothetical protein FD175_2825 [Beijerinckiaceae bacterium]
MTMAHAILVAVISGIATALMSGLLTPGVAPAVFLSLLAPTPLFIAGFGWHPLVAALGGLVAALIGNFVIGPPAALMIAGMIALPAYALTALSDRLFSDYAGRPDKDGLDLGRLAVTLVLYIGIAGVMATLIFEPDYAQLEARIRRAVEMVFVASGLDKAMPNASKDDLARIFALMTNIMLPVSALISLVTVVVSGTLGLQIADRAKRVPYARPDFRRFRLPGGSLILFGITLAVASRAGYVGLLGEIVALGLAFAYMLQGCAALTVVTNKKSNKVFLTVIVLLLASMALFFATGQLLFIALFMLANFTATVMVLILISIGLADHLMNFRRGRL